MLIAEGAAEQAEPLALQMELLAPIMLLDVVRVEAEDMVTQTMHTEAQAEFQAVAEVEEELTLVVMAVPAVMVVVGVAVNAPPPLTAVDGTVVVITSLVVM